MPPLMTKAPFKGKVRELLRNPSRAAGLEKSRVKELELSFEGIAGDCHSGATRPADVRTLLLYKRDTPIRNVRQLTVVSVEELGDIATAMGLDKVEAAWLGANLLVEGIPDFTLLPPSTRLQFPSGATIVVDMENKPCRQVADVISQYHPNAKKGFVASADVKRGITAWVEREGAVRLGDEVTLVFPPNRIYPHAPQA